jgi:hypothetical protein
MTLDDYKAGVRPKVLGTSNLHKLTSSEPLDFFIMLSSLVGIVGYASQSSYAAGGAYQDALARYRVSQGLPGVAIDLGQVKSVGYVAENQGTAERLVRQGFSLLSEDDVLRTLETAILNPFAGQLVIGLNSGPGEHWEQASIARDSRFTSIKYRQDSQNASAGANKVGLTELGSKLADATSLDDAVQAVADCIVQKLVNIFMLSADDLNLSKPLSDYGVDSLVAVELRNMLALGASAEVSIFDIMQSTSIKALAMTVACRSNYISPSLVTAAEQS